MQTEENHMKIICDKTLLNFAVQTVQKAVATKTPMPILTGIYIATKDNQIELEATDYEIGITCTMDAQILEPGSIVISGKYLQEMVRRLPGETVNIETNQEDKTILITSGTAQFNLLSMPPEEFPIIQRLKTDNKITIKDNILRDLIKKTIFACATDESRPIFTGGLMETRANDIRLIATNTHRLAFKKNEIALQNKKLQIIIPSKILQEVAKSLTSDVPIDIEITWTQNQVAFSFDGVYILSRLIEGQFPDYNRVIPNDFSTEIKVDKELFLAAVERVALLSRDGDYNIIKFLFKNESIMITSNNPEIGKACEVIPGNISGKELEIAFNAKYITDILKNLDSDIISISLNTSLSPGSIRPIDDDTYIYVITPVRIN